MSHNQFAAVVVLSTAIDGLTVAACLFQSRRIDVGRLAGAAALAASLFLVKLLPLSLLGLKVFGLIHLAYVDLTVMVPAVSLALLIVSVAAAERRGLTVTRGARLVALGALLLVPVGLYATWIEPFRLRLETARVLLPSAREGASELRIGVLADLQTARVTEYEQGAVRRLMALKPDIILMPGDLFQGTPAEFAASRESLRELLSELSAPGGVYFVLGDFDGPGPAIERLLRSSGIRLLVDEVVRVSIRGRSVTIGGVRLDVASGPARDVVGALETAAGDGDVRILMAHRPDVALVLRADSRIDLVVAGHTHGGQVVIPGFGPPVTLTRVPRRIAAGGLHPIAGTRIYVSRGVGCERGQAPRIRFFCPPEISLLELAGDRQATPMPE